MGTRVIIIHTEDTVHSHHALTAQCCDDGLCKCSEHKPKRPRHKIEHKTSTGVLCPKELVGYRHQCFFYVFNRKMDNKLKRADKEIVRKDCR